eukprot:3004921-Prymnesium_polylepis.1
MAAARPIRVVKRHRAAGQTYVRQLEIRTLHQEEPRSLLAIDRCTVSFAPHPDGPAGHPQFSSAQRVRASRRQ